MLDKSTSITSPAPSPDPDRGRIDVIRHRARSHLRGRGRVLLAVGVSLVFITGGGIAAATSGSDSDTAPAAALAPASPDATEQALSERSDDARSDRSERSEPDQAGNQAAPPEESPEPEPEPEPVPEPEPEPEEEAPAPDWVHPMPDAATTSCYGFRWGVLHAGVDLASPAGTPVRAVGAGTVNDAGWVFGGYGISVLVDHGNGILTHYGHLSEAHVSAGESVSPGDTIGLEGSTGDSTGPHLHFEVHAGAWNQIEPTGWMRDQGVDIGGC